VFLDFETAKKERSEKNGKDEKALMDEAGVTAIE
jgi:hypothetical protein